MMEEKHVNGFYYSMRIVHAHNCVSVRAFAYMDAGCWGAWLRNLCTATTQTVIVFGSIELWCVCVLDASAVVCVCVLSAHAKGQRNTALAWTTS